MPGLNYVCDGCGWTQQSPNAHRARTSKLRADNDGDRVMPAKLVIASHGLRRQARHLPMVRARAQG